MSLEVYVEPNAVDILNDIHPKFLSDISDFRKIENKELQINANKRNE